MTDMVGRPTHRSAPKRPLAERGIRTTYRGLPSISIMDMISFKTLGISLARRLGDGKKDSFARPRPRSEIAL